MPTRVNITNRDLFTWLGHQGYHYGAKSTPTRAAFDPPEGRPAIGFPRRPASEEVDAGVAAAIAKALGLKRAADLARMVHDDTPLTTLSAVTPAPTNGRAARNGATAVAPTPPAGRPRARVVPPTEAADPLDSIWAVSPSPAVTAGPWVTVVTVTPVQAADWLEHNAFPLQRPIRRHLVTRFSEALRLGDWKPTSSLAFASLPDGTIYLLDGQHRLRAVVDSGVTMTALVATHTCADLDEAAALYATYDRGGGRTVGDAFRAMGLPEEVSLNPRQAAQAAAAMTLLENGFEAPVSGQLVSAEVRARQVRAWAAEIASFYVSIAGCPPRVRDYITTAAVLAVALVTFRWQPDSAAPFWRDVSHDDGLRAGTGQHTLLRYLREKRVIHERQHIYARRVAACWNAAASGKSLARIFRSKLEVASELIKIAGTPYDGRTLVLIDDQGRVDSIR